MIEAAVKEAKRAVEIGELQHQSDVLVHLDILSDCLDYGSFFAPANHREVHKALCSAAETRGIAVRLLVCSEHIPEPFTGPSGQELHEYPNCVELLHIYQQTLLSDASFMDWLGRLNDARVAWPRIAKSWFFELVNGVEMPDWPTLLTSNFGLEVGNEKGEHQHGGEEERKLKQILQIRQLWFATKLQGAGVKIRWLPRRKSLFLWAKYRHRGHGTKDVKNRHIDDDALFTFAHAMGGEAQLGFSTHDHDLLDSFRVLFEATWDKADPKTWEKDPKDRGPRKPGPYWPDVLREIDVGAVQATGADAETRSGIS
jgi:hypothetical protein